MNGWHVTFFEGGGTRVAADGHPCPTAGLEVLVAGSRLPRVTKSRRFGSPGRRRPGAASQQLPPGSARGPDPSRNPFLQPVRRAQRRTSTVAQAMAAQRARWAP